MANTKRFSIHQHWQQISTGNVTLTGCNTAATYQIYVGDNMPNADSDFISDTLAQPTPYNFDTPVWVKLNVTNTLDEAELLAIGDLKATISVENPTSTQTIPTNSNNGSTNSPTANESTNTNTSSNNTASDNSNLSNSSESTVDLSTYMDSLKLTGSMNGFAQLTADISLLPSSITLPASAVYCNYPYTQYLYNAPSNQVFDGGQYNGYFSNSTPVILSNIVLQDNYLSTNSISLVIEYQGKTYERTLSLNTP